MSANNKAFVKAYNNIWGNQLDDIKQLKGIRFEGDDVEDCLVRLCEGYHQEKLDQDSCLIVGERQFEELETTIIKWTNPAYLIYRLIQFICVFIYSLFVNSKDFKK